MAEIKLEQVTKIYEDGTEAVTDVTLGVEDGTLMVLVGPSGCGKTTILRMVAGLEEITDGDIWIGDQLVNEMPAKNRDIAMVFQNYALYPHMTVYENMAFGLKLRKVKRREVRKRVDEAARILGLSDMLKKKPRHLSGGQRQRVAMGRAIVREPQVFLMDEPLSNLDAKLRVQMRAEISRIQRDVGVTTIYVTHDQTEAMTLGDQVAVLKNGLLQQVDSPHALYQRPVNLFVGGFIGSPAMNMVDASLQSGDGDGELWVRFGSHRLRLDPEAVASHPALRGYAGRRIVLGIRPEEMEDAAILRDVPDDRRMKATIDLREDMGSEIYVHFSVDAPPVLTEDTKELAVDRGDETLAQLEEEAAARQTIFVGRFSNASRVREADSIEIAVDTAKMLFFDPSTGEAVRDRVPSAV
jgi:multiple sugar transport system ATP-binding protein